MSKSCVGDFKTPLVEELKVVLFEVFSQLSILGDKFGLDLGELVALEDFGPDT
jgi:hypothetical protein